MSAPDPVSRPRPRPRVSPRRYLARRLGVGAVAASLVFVLVWGLGAALGGDGGEPESLAEASTTVAGAAPVATDPATSPPPTDAAGGSPIEGADEPALAVTSVPTSASPNGESSTSTTAAAPTSAPAAPTAPPTAEAPARVLVVGDSDAGTFGPYLETLLDETGVAETTVDYKVSSGLSRPDFFDWPGHLRATLPVVDPQVVVVTFGGNDAQGLSLPSGEFTIRDPVGEKAEWQAEYTRRALEVLDILLEGGGRTVIWVGIPNDDNPDVTERMSVQDEAARAAVTQRPAVQFIDTWARFSGRSGGWAEYVVDPRDGVGKDVRAEDGFHLNETGAEILALDIAEAVEQDLRARGSAI